MTSQLRLAVIGAGWASDLHLQGFAAVPGVEPVGIASRTRSTAEDVASRYAIPHVYTDVAQMLRETEPDIVSIATPPGSHREYTLMAIERGCHVLCDKPVALTAGDAEEMLHAAERAGVRHATGFIWRNDPGIVRMREMLAENAIGEVTDIHCRSAVGAPVLPMTWLYDRDAGGGALMQHGQHVIDRAAWLLGDEISAVCGELHHDVDEAVVGPRFHNVFDAFGWAARRAAPGGAGETLPTAPISADTGYAFSATFAGGVRGYFWESWHSTGPSPDRIDVHAKRGALSWSGAGGLRLVRPGPGRQPEPIAVDSVEAGSGDLKGAQQAGHRYWRELAQAFVNDINGCPHAPYPTLHDGWRAQRVVDAVRASAESGSWQESATAARLAAR
jgi:predicted dehydrogenase